MRRKRRTRLAKTAPRATARVQLAGARRRYEGSWAEDVVTQLRALDLGEWTLLFGASCCGRCFRSIILLSSLATERIDDDLSRHIGASGQGVRVIRELFRNSPTFLVVPVLTGLLFAFVGTITVAHSVQVLYERAFDQEPHGWRDIPRSVVWLVVLLGALVLESTISHPGGPRRVR